MAGVRLRGHCNFAYHTLWLHIFRCISMLSCQTISSMVVLLSGPLVGTPEFLSYGILCCIYVAGLIEAGCFPTSEMGVNNVLPDLD